MEISIAKECREIKAICEKHGYGNVMEWASALWRYDYMKKGYDKMLGACAGTVGGGKMKHLGDITLIHGNEIEPVDCIIGGSPCQDLSVAGKRAGLSGERSGLFMEQIRIVKEMRNRYGKPRYMVWENVPGAFSSNSGEDFRAVLEEITKIADETAVIPRPPKGKWAYAGCIMGDGWSIAWRTHDAQFWGVPQRRRRIALVADFGGESAPEILFERESVSRDSEPGGTPWQGITADAQSGTGTDDRERGENCLTPWDMQSRRIFSVNGAWSALYSGEGGGHGYIAYPETQNIVAFAQNQRDEVRDLGDKAGALAAEPGMKQQTFIVQCHDTIGNGTCNADVREENEIGIIAIATQQGGAEISQNGKCPTITAAAGMSGNNQPWVCYEARDNGDGKTAATITGDHENRVTDYTTVCVSGDDVADTLDASYYKGCGERGFKERTVVADRATVRRLTPLECERLQGYPDGWTDIGDWTDSKGKKHKSADAPRYKALGNSIALPFWFWMLRRMSEYLPTGATMGSLFDGIGGFPLCWETIHGKGKARWASEIEEFAIAVTKMRFPKEDK